MIDVKALRPAAPRPKTPEEAYRASQVDPAPSRLPAVFAFLLGAFAVYLKSMFPAVPEAGAHTAGRPSEDVVSGPPKVTDLEGAVSRDGVQSHGAKPEEPGLNAIDQVSQIEAASMILGLPDHSKGNPTPAALPMTQPLSPAYLKASTPFLANDNAGPGPAGTGASGGSAQSQGSGQPPSAVSRDDKADDQPDQSPTPATPATPAESRASGQPPSTVSTEDRADDQPDMSPTPDTPADEDDDDTITRNRAPRIGGSVFLPDISACQLAFIAAIGLLSGATDADGDTLTVQQLVASSGELTPTDGGWTFKPAEGMSGPVTFSYIISDGAEIVAQNASLTVTERADMSGTAGDDLLLGTDCADIIDGLAGNDLIDARSGNDVIVGGPGADHIVAGAGNDVIDAGSGNDIVFGGSGDDTIAGGEGDDRLYGEAGDDVIQGDAGDDLIVGGAGSDQLFGGAGNDLVVGGDGDDVLSGGDGNDVIHAGTGNNLILTGEGDNHVTTADGANVVVAGSGTDRIETGAGRDVVTAGAGADKLDGGAGDDVLSGEIGDDTIFGGSGDDTILGGQGDDALDAGSGSDEVHGEDGNDTIIVTLDASNDIYDGGAGLDTLDLSNATVSVDIDLEAGTVTSIEIGIDTISDLERIIGGSGPDHFLVGIAAVTIAGGDGDDTFVFRIGDTDHERELIHRILDLEPGDRIEFREFAIMDNADVDDDAEFEDAYDNGEEGSERPFRFRIERLGDDEKTYIDVDSDDVGDPLFIIEIDGIHRLHFA